MSSPNFLTGGSTPRRSDTKWFIQQRILGALVDGLAGGSGNLSGSGSPEGVVDGSEGQLYVDEVFPYSVWVKTSASGVLTGWFQKLE